MKQNSIGLGIDSVDIHRFALWHTYSQKSLTRIFSSEEIKYCLSIPAKSAERFAARFAVREALLKALRQAMPEAQIPLLRLCAAVQITTNSNSSPHLLIDWPVLNATSAPAIICLASWTHTALTATAIVIIFQDKS